MNAVLPTKGGKDWMGFKQIFWRHVGLPRRQPYPRRSDNQEYGEEEERGQETDAVELALRQVAASDEDDVLAAGLGCYDGKVAAGEQKRERHERYRDAAAPPHVEEYAEQRENLRGLADEQVMNRHIDDD